MDVRGTTALVIGGGSGIGRGIAVALAGAGANVALGDIEVDSAERVRGEIEAAGGSAMTVRVDATDRSSLQAAADAVVDRFGAVHVLSNNVGVALLKRLEDSTDADWAWAFEFNVLAMVRAVDVFLPLLRRNPGRAHIVNTASTAALVVITSPEHGWGAGQPVGVYTATKHAVLGYSETLRAELREYGIGVSVLCPGGVDSQLRNTSARNRPERFGGPFDPGVRGKFDPPRITAEDVGRMVVLGVEENRAHILTHPEWATDVTARYQALMSDFGFFSEHS